MPTRFLAIFALIALVLTTPSATTAQGYDVLIRNGTVIDGTGASSPANQGEGEGKG